MVNKRGLFVLILVCFALILLIINMNNVSAEKTCRNYERAVSYGIYERYLESSNLDYAKKNEEQCRAGCVIDADDGNLCHCKIKKYNLYIYKPGGIPFQKLYSFNTKREAVVLSELNADCGLYEYKKIYDDSDPYTPPIYYIMAESQKLLASCPLSDDELSGKKRNTGGDSEFYPEQFIDSFRGELGFDDFWKDVMPVELKSKDNGFCSAGTNIGQFCHVNADCLNGECKKWKWETKCVKKDKCADNAGNSEPKPLIETFPYSYYLLPVEYVTHENVKVKFNYNGFTLGFADVDDPSCKFEEDIYFPDQLTDDFPIFDWPENYLKRPYSIAENNKLGTSYCYDPDGDGFCGRPTQIASDLSIPKWSTKYKVATDENELAAKQYQISKSFPDCDDRVEDDDKKYKLGIPSGSPNPTSFKDIPLLGWITQPEDPDYQHYRAWTVHPLSLVTDAMCPLGVYDFNCNKDGFDGYDIFSMQIGKTPFDFDLETGKEITQTSWVRSTPGDFVCTQASLIKRVEEAALAPILAFAGGATQIGAASIAAVHGGNFVYPGAGYVIGAAIYVYFVFTGANDIRKDVLKDGGYQLKSWEEIDGNKLFLHSSQFVAVLLGGPAAAKRTGNPTMAQLKSSASGLMAENYAPGATPVEKAVTRAQKRMVDQLRKIAEKDAAKITEAERAKMIAGVRAQENLIGASRKDPNARAAAALAQSAKELVKNAIAESTPESIIGAPPGVIGLRVSIKTPLGNVLASGFLRIFAKERYAVWSFDKADTVLNGVTQKIYSELSKTLKEYHISELRNEYHGDGSYDFKLANWYLEKTLPEREAILKAIGNIPDGLEMSKHGWHVKEANFRDGQTLRVVWTTDTVAEPVVIGQEGTVLTPAAPINPEDVSIPIDTATADALAGYRINLVVPRDARIQNPTTLFPRPKINIINPEK
ncbi:hypothetical protein J4217_04725 [Candidatus Pacearchaeota archaeon]|nr:hypothetical protein [Candidatus Pacearchaeota archaeon]